jgi:LacI family transcriptional regulator
LILSSKSVLMKSTKTTLVDIAKALGVSIGTVHRALHNHPGINQETKNRVLQEARRLGYRANRAARSLSMKRRLRISVNTLKGTTSFWDEVRAGIEQEARSLGMESVEIQYRTYPQLGDGDESAFEAALKDEVNGIIMFPSSPGRLRGWLRRAAPAQVPIVCVATDAPGTGRLAVVSIDTMVSGSLAADLLGRFLNGHGTVAVTVSDLAILEHAEKVKAFQSTLRSFYPQMQLEAPLEDHDIEAEAYVKCRQLFQSRPDLAGVYVTTEASIPVLNAARDAGILDRLAVITTDLFPELVEEIRSGTVAATIHQRPRTQGVMAFRVLHDFLVDHQTPSPQVTLAPHLVMRGNLDFFLQRQSFEHGPAHDDADNVPSNVDTYSVG